MRGPSRREVVERSLAAAFVTLSRCGGNTPCVGVDDPIPGATLVGLLPFLDDTGAALEVDHGAELDARFTTDLSTLTGDSPVIPTERFYVRTGPSPLLDLADDWVIRVRGLATAVDLRLVDLLDLVEDQGAVLLECSGNSSTAQFGLMSAATFAGIPLPRLLERLSIDPAATRLRIGGFDEYPLLSGTSTAGCAWVYTFDQLADAFFAVEMNGEPLTVEHGFPVRLVLPGWYGCCCTKWVDELVFVDEDEPATSQMIEFAVRTEQEQVWTLAREYTPATIDQVAVPVRVEQWRTADGGTVYRVVGLMWGGDVPTDTLQISFGGAFEPVQSCPRPADNRTWTLWSHTWAPRRPGDYDIVLRIDDPTIRTRRLDRGWYLRSVRVTDV